MVPKHGPWSQVDLGLCLGPTHSQVTLDSMFNFFEPLFPCVKMEVILNPGPCEKFGSQGLCL